MDSTILISLSFVLCYHVCHDNKEYPQPSGDKVSNEWYVYYYLNQSDIIQFGLTERQFSGKVICSCRRVCLFSVSGFMFLMKNPGVSAAISSG